MTQTQMDVNCELSKKDIIRGIIKAGCLCLPASSNTKYCDGLKWSEYKKPLSLEQFNALNNGFDGICIVTGQRSGNLEVLDFDKKIDPKVFNELLSAYKDLVKSEAPGLFEKLVIEKTQSGGRHIFFKCSKEKTPGNTKLSFAKVEVDGPDQHEHFGDTYTARQDHEGKWCIYPCVVETRGEGGLIVCYPTPGYELSQGEIDQIPDISAHERDILIRCAQAFNQYIDPERMVTGGQKLDSKELRPGDDFTQRGDILPTLEKHGWVVVSTVGIHTRLRRPGKSDGWSATLAEGKVFYVFSTNTEFEDRHGYTIFAVYAILEHGGDFRAAAKDLAAHGYGARTQDSSGSSNEQWQTAREIAPRVSFPWHVLPLGIEQSLKQLARSCATSPTPLPGIAFAYLAAAIGRKVNVSPKYSWKEPLIFWCADIRDSGEGKTPPMVALGKAFENLQKDEEERYEKEVEEYDLLNKEEKKAKKKPTPKRTYFLTDLTLESIVPSLKGHPTGGIVIAMSELSQFITSQNQYKQGKGSDRESWLKLHDGTAANLGRAGGNKFVSNCRVQLVGGVQPGIFKDVFGQDQYQKDGTNFRCLFTYDGPQFHEMTAESWTEENQEAWKDLMLRTVEWADKQEEKTQVVLDQEAQELFFDWGNELKAKKNNLPAVIRGFLPKVIGYALRFAGILHCLDGLMSIYSIPKLLNKDTMHRGIELSMFYLGQAVDAMQIIKDEDTTPPPENTERTQELAHLLESLRSEVDNGRLAVGYIQEKFNEICKPEHRIKSPHAMGAWLRSLRLNLSNGKHEANGRRAVRCLVWDESLESCLQSLQSLRNQEPRWFPDADIVQTNSAKSVSKSAQTSEMQTLQTCKYQSLHPGNTVKYGPVDNTDNDDNFSGSSEKSQYDFNDAPIQRMAKV